MLARVLLSVNLHKKIKFLASSIRKIWLGKKTLARSSANADEPRDALCY